MSHFGGHLMPVVAVRLHNPAVLTPARDDLAQGRLVTHVALESPQVVEGERRRQLVEHRVVDAAPLSCPEKR